MTKINSDKRRVSTGATIILIMKLTDPLSGIQLFQGSSLMHITFMAILWNNVETSDYHYKDLSTIHVTRIALIVLHGITIFFEFLHFPGAL